MDIAQLLGLSGCKNKPSLMENCFIVSGGAACNLKSLYARYRIYAEPPNLSVTASHSHWLNASPSPWSWQAFEVAARRAGVNVFSAEKFVVGDAEAPRVLRVG